MIAIFIVILSNSFVFVLFKLFHRYQIIPQKAIFINYLTATLISLSYTVLFIDTTLIRKVEWIFPAAIIGIIYVLNFYVINLCTKKFNLAVTSLIGKISVIIPILVGVFILQEKLNALRIIGICGALLSLYFILKPKGKFLEHPHNDYKKYAIPLLLFLFYGISDSLFQVSQKKLFLSSIYPTNHLYDNENQLFVSVVFVVCFIFSTFLLFFKTNKDEKKITKRDIYGGMALGIVNLLGGYMLLEAISSVNDTGILFAIISIGIVLLTTFIGWIYFKEKLRLVNIIGIAIAIFSLILLNI